MSKLVANINGCDVYSDKQVRSIVNNVITFSDGSWCNVTTGEIVNNGNGYISFNSQSKSEDGKGEQETLGPKSYRATALDVRAINANVDIQPIKGDEMVVTIKGPNSEINNINVDVINDVLIVQDKGSGKNHHSNINICGNSVSISSNSSIISIGKNLITDIKNSILSSGSARNQTQISIGVPRGSAVKIFSQQEETTIGDTEGPLTATLQGNGAIDVGKVGNAILVLQGHGDIEVDNVVGDLVATVQGSGDITVSNGSVKTLNANVMGSGDFTFIGKATNANLSIMGSGDIDVNYVENKPNKSIMGDGDINVGNW
jgi:hypothetical protein